MWPQQMRRGIFHFVSFVFNLKSHKGPELPYWMARPYTVTLTPGRPSTPVATHQCPDASLSLGSLVW